MTVRTIITRAGRIIQEANEGARALPSYTASEVGLNAFNDMMREMRGVQIGQRLSRVWDATSGSTALVGGIHAVDVYTPARPLNGDRFRVLGARTVTATDDTIEGAASVTTTESSSWMYREDQGDWQKEEALTLDDPSPLQDECDEALALLTAARMYLEQAGELSPTLSALAVQGRNRIRQIYSRWVRVAAESAVLRGLAHRTCGAAEFD